MSYPYFSLKDKSVRAGPFNGGIMIDIPKHEIGDANSPDMLNMVYDSGILSKRKGQKILFDNGENQIESCLSETFYGYIIYCSKRTLKAYNIKSGEITILYEKIPQKKGEFFSYNGYVYYIGSGEYYKISYSDNKLSADIVEGYIPYKYINCDPQSGTGDDNEPANLLTGKFKASFNTSSGMLSVCLPEAVDVSSVEIEYNGQNLQGGFSVSSDSVVNFLNPKFQDGHNTLIVTAKSLNSDEDRRKITLCDAAVSFGGSVSGLSEGTRVFVSGNREYANTFFKSYLKNPEYFPVDGFEILGDVLDPIVGFGKQGGGLVIFKENSIYVSLYDYSSGEPVFTITNISAGMGCDSKETIDYIDNRLLWFHKRYGVMMLASVLKSSSENVKVISQNINGSGSDTGLLFKDNYNSPKAFVLNNRYHLCTDKYCYVFDGQNGYSLSDGKSFSWYLYSDIDCRCKVRDKDKLYIGTARERFTYFSDCLYDYSEENPIKAHYVTKAYNLGKSSVMKTVKDISLLLRAVKNSYVEITAECEDGEMKGIKSHRINKFSFDNFIFSDFTFFDGRFAVFIKRKINMKRVKFFSLKFENHEPLSDMAISEITINYKEERGAKVNGI